MEEQKTFLGNSITDVNSKLSKWLSNYDIVNQILFRAFILPKSSGRKTDAFRG